MVATIYKWFLLSFCCSTTFIDPIPQCSSQPAGVLHPFFVSVVEVEHNSNAKTLEISCKLFTDDFEKTLRQNNKVAVDLVNVKDRPAMNKLVTEYVKKHLTISVDGKPFTMNFQGFEKEEEAVYSYWQVDNVPSVKKINITDNLLYDYKPEQTGIVHVVVGGKRKSTKVVNPEDKVEVQF